MATVLIVNATPNPKESDALAYYSEHAGAILKAHNGKLISKYIISKSIASAKLESNVMIMEFEDDAIIESLSSGETYVKLIPYRDKAFIEISISFAQKVV